VPLLLLLSAPALANPAKVNADVPPVPAWITLDDLDPGVNSIVDDLVAVYQRQMPLGDKVEKMRTIWEKEEAPFDRVHDTRGMGEIDNRASALVEELIKAEATAIAADTARPSDLRLADLDALEAFATQLDFLPERYRSSVRMDMSFARASLREATNP